jgi:hypothetical protein
MIENQVHLNAVVYQNMFNIIVGFPIWRCANVFMDVMMWEHWEIPGQDKVYYTNNIIITSFV